MVDLVLASASPTRAAMFKAAGLGCIIDPAQVDEGEVKTSLRHSGARAGDGAEALAELKARQVSRRHPGALVIGADQILECDGIWYDKPADVEAARVQLLMLRGKTHRLASSAVIVRDGARLWHHSAFATLTMRPFTEAFLDAYLSDIGAAAFASVGGYQVEGQGVQLFSRIEGDHFVILGLPLLPLLDFLRIQGVVAT